MPKATRKNITKMKSKAAPREGLSLINATHQAKMAREPNLERELKTLRRSNDAMALAVLYDAYMAAADAMLGIENQPRAQGGATPLLRGEGAYLIMKAWMVAEQLAKMQPSDETEREVFVRSLFNCAIDMTGDLDAAKSVLQAAMGAGIAK